jgi:putative flippase GtrA
MASVPHLLGRLSRFGLVGAGGVAVQILILEALLWFEAANYLLATFLAVESSILFNFIWHRRWTWADRPRERTGSAFLRFNFSTGAVSIGMNLLLMYLFVGTFGLRPLLSNLMAIAICSIINFTLADRFVFV